MRHISILIHGWWGAGKSWLAASAPGPRLVIDTEGGFYDTPGRIVPWDPHRQEVPHDLHPDDSVVVDVRDWGTLEEVRQILKRGEHPFKSVIVDSLHELQDQLKRAVAVPGEEYNPNAVFQQQAWGRLLNNMALFLRDLRDLTRPTAVHPVHVVLVSGSDDELIPAKPLLEGKARKIVIGFYDVVGYMTEARDQNGEIVRVLQINPTSTAVAKCRIHALHTKYGTDIPNPNLTTMIQVANEAEES